MIRRLFTLAAVAAAASLAYADDRRALDPAPDGAFTIAIVPDTQRYLGPGSGREDDAGEPRNPAFESRLAWIAENIAAQRIVFVSHMGDIVDRNEERQWRVARAAMDRIHGLVPYAISVGNHDMVRDSGDSSLFQAHFGAERFQSMPWYGGAYEGRPGHAPAVSGGNANSFQLFSAGGLDFVIAHLECNAPDDVLAWAESVFAEHRDRMAIITTHMYLGGVERRSADAPQGRMEWKKVHGDRGNTPRQLWEKAFAAIPNLFLVLCGDQSVSITHHQTSRGEHGNAVHEILTDYPRDADDSDWIRLLRFHPDRGALHVLTYSPAQDRLCDGLAHVSAWEDHQFALDISEAIAAHRARRNREPAQTR